MIEQPNENESVVFVVTNDSNLFGFMCSDHSMFYCQSIGSSISALWGLSNPMGGFMLAFGSQKGVVSLKSNFDDLPDKFECGVRINCLMYSENLRYLIIGAHYSKVFICEFQKDNIFDTKPIEITLLTGNPIHFNMLLNQETFLMLNSTLSQLQVV